MKVFYVSWYFTQFSTCKINPLFLFLEVNSNEVIYTHNYLKKKLVHWYVFNKQFSKKHWVKNNSLIWIDYLKMLQVAKFSGNESSKIKK